MNIERSKQIIDGLSRFAFADDIKQEFEASPKLLLEIEQFTDKKMENIAKDIGEQLEEGYWAAIRAAVERELSR